MLDEWSNLYESQTVKDHQRFYDPAYDSQQFHEEAAQIDDFFAGRFAFAMEDLAETFSLTGELTHVTINVISPEGGTVTVNTATLEDCSVWDGYYYSDFPISVSANPKEGWHFVGWKGDVSGLDKDLTVTLDGGDVSIQAVFEKNEYPSIACDIPQ